MQIALILTGTSVVREREKKTLEQLLVTPMSKTTFIIGKLLPYIVIALLDFYFILGAGWALFDLPQPVSHLLLFLLAVIFVAVMISLGLLISLIAKTQQQAMFIAIFIIIPSVLLSGFIFPAGGHTRYCQTDQLHYSVYLLCRNNSGSVNQAHPVFRPDMVLRLTISICPAVRFCKHFEVQTDTLARIQGSKPEIYIRKAELHDTDA